MSHPIPPPPQPTRGVSFPTTPPPLTCRLPPPLSPLNSRLPEPLVPSPRIRPPPLAQKSPTPPRPMFRATRTVGAPSSGTLSEESKGDGGTKDSQRSRTPPSSKSPTPTPTSASTAPTTPPPPPPKAKRATGSTPTRSLAKRPSLHPSASLPNALPPRLSPIPTLPPPPSSIPLTSSASFSNSPRGGSQVLPPSPPPPLHRSPSPLVSRSFSPFVSPPPPLSPSLSPSNLSSPQSNIVSPLGPGPMSPPQYPHQSPNSVPRSTFRIQPRQSSPSFRSPPAQVPLSSSSSSSQSPHTSQSPRASQSPRTSQSPRASQSPHTSQSSPHTSQSPSQVTPSSPFKSPPLLPSPAFPSLSLLQSLLEEEESKIASLSLSGLKKCFKERVNDGISLHFPSLLQNLPPFGSALADLLLPIPHQESKKKRKLRIRALKYIYDVLQLLAYPNSAEHSFSPPYFSSTSSLSSSISTSFSSSISTSAVSLTGKHLEMEDASLNELGKLLEVAWFKDRWPEIFYKTALARTKGLTPKETNFVKELFTEYANYIRVERKDPSGLLSTCLFDLLSFLSSHIIDPCNLIIGARSSTILERDLISFKEEKIRHFDKVSSKKKKEEKGGDDGEKVNEEEKDLDKMLEQEDGERRIYLERKLFRWLCMKKNLEQVYQEMQEWVKDEMSYSPGVTPGELVLVHAIALPSPYREWYTNKYWETDRPSLIFARAGGNCSPRKIHVLIDPMETVGVNLDFSDVMRLRKKQIDIIQETIGHSGPAIENPLLLFFPKVIDSLVDGARDLIARKGRVIRNENYSSIYDLKRAMEQKADHHEYTTELHRLCNELAASLTALLYRWIMSLPTGLFCPPRLTPSVCELESFLDELPTLIRKEFMRYHDNDTKQIKKLEKRIQSILDGSRKEELCEWWLSHIETKSDEYLADCGYVASALSPDYTDKPPSDLLLVNKNLTVIQENMKIECASLQEFVGKTTDQVYEVLDILMEEMDYCLKGEWEELGLDLEHTEEQRLSLERDSVYLKNMKDMDEEIMEKRRNGKLEKMAFEMSDVVPVAGLVMARFHIHECETLTALEIWDPKPPGLGLSNIGRKSYADIPSNIISLYIAEAEKNEEESSGSKPRPLSNSNPLLAEIFRRRNSQSSLTISSDTLSSSSPSTLSNPPEPKFPSPISLGIPSSPPSLAQSEYQSPDEPSPIPYISPFAAQGRSRSRSQFHCRTIDSKHPDLPLPSSPPTLPPSAVSEEDPPLASFSLPSSSSVTSFLDSPEIAYISPISSINSVSPKSSRSRSQTEISLPTETRQNPSPNDPSSPIQPNPPSPQPPAPSAQPPTQSNDCSPPRPPRQRSRKPLSEMRGSTKTLFSKSSGSWVDTTGKLLKTKEKDRGGKEEGEAGESKEEDNKRSRSKGSLLWSPHRNRKQKSGTNLFALKNAKVEKDSAKSDREDEGEEKVILKPRKKVKLQPHHSTSNSFSQEGNGNCGGGGSGSKKTLASLKLMTTTPFSGGGKMSLDSPRRTKHSPRPRASSPTSSPTPPSPIDSNSPLQRINSSPISLSTITPSLYGSSPSSPTSSPRGGKSPRFDIPVGMKPRLRQGGGHGQQAGEDGTKEKGGWGGEDEEGGEDGVKVGTWISAKHVT